MNFPASGSTTRTFFKVIPAIPLALYMAFSMPLQAAPRLPVTVTCMANPASLFPGDPVTVTVLAANLDPKLNAIYSWSGAGVTGSGSTATVATGSLAPGAYTVHCGVKVGKHGKEGQKPWQAAESSATFTVKAFEPPTISVIANPRMIKPGETATITAVGVSPQNRHLTYHFSAPDGTVSSNGNTAVFSSAGAPTGSVSFTVTVTDDKGHTATSTTSVTIIAPMILSPPKSIRALPQFPWPPPQASTSRVLPVWPLGPHMRTFGDIDSKLTTALDAKGYTERSYYSVPEGFALVTRLEQIYPDGRSKMPPSRFSAELLPASNFSDYIFALFHANPGYYRVIVFVVTDQIIVQGTKAPEQSEVTHWLAAGANFLPDPLASQHLTQSVKCTALIYEFEMGNSGTDPSPKAHFIPSTAEPVAQLQRAGLWQAFAH